MPLVGPVNALTIIFAAIALLIGALLMLGVLAASALIDGTGIILLAASILLMNFSRPSNTS